MTSRKFALIWLGTSLLALNVGMLGLAVLVTLVTSSEVPFVTRLMGLSDAFIIFNVVGLAATPFVGVMLYGWVRVVRRSPVLESTRWMATLSNFGLVVAMTAVLAVLTDWEALLRPNHPASMKVGFFVAAATIFPWLAMAVLLPRIAVPSLRPPRTNRA